jgi:hypothetical protein
MTSQGFQFGFRFNHLYFSENLRRAANARRCPMRRTLEKGCLKDRGPKPAAQFGVQYLYAPDEMVRYARIWRRIWRARLCVSSAPLPPSRAKQLLDVLSIAFRFLTLMQVLDGRTGLATTPVPTEVTASVPAKSAPRDQKGNIIREGWSRDASGPKRRLTAASLGRPTAGVCTRGDPLRFIGIEAIAEQPVPIFLGKARRPLMLLNFRWQLCLNLRAQLFRHLAHVGKLQIILPRYRYVVVPHRRHQWI